jgi:hypothetical protein
MAASSGVGGRVGDSAAPGIPDEHDRPFGLVDGGDDRIDVVAQAAPPPVDSRRPRLRRGRLVRGWGTTAQVSTGV